MKLIFCFLVSTILCTTLTSQDNTNWVSQFENLDGAPFPTFRAKHVLVDKDSNYYLFGKSKGVSISNDTLQSEDPRLNDRHFVSKFSKSGEFQWIKDSELRWKRSWLMLDSQDNFHCLKQSPVFFDRDHNKFDIIYDRFDTDWNLLENFRLVTLGPNIQSDYFLSSEIVDKNLFVAFPLSGSTYFEIDGTQYSIEPDSLGGEYIILIKYDLETRELKWINKLYSDEFRSVHIETTVNGDVYLATNFLQYISIDDGDIQFSNNNCGNCPELLIAKFDSEGNLKWERQITDGSQKGVKDILEYNDNLYVLGNLFALDLKFDDFTISGINSVFLLSMNEDGNFTNAKSFDFSSWQSANSVERTDDGHIIVTGSYIGEGLTGTGDILLSSSVLDENAFIHYLNEDFEYIKSIGIYGGSVRPDRPLSGANLINDIEYHDGKLAIAGNFSSNSIILDTTLNQSNFEFTNVYNTYLALLEIKIDSFQTVSTSELGELDTQYNYFKIAPNPTGSTFRIICKNEEIIDVKIIDSAGHTILHKPNWNTLSDSHSLSLNGMYFVHITHKNVYQNATIIMNNSK